MKLTKELTAAWVGFSISKSMVRKYLKGIPDVVIVEVKNSHGKFNAYNCHVRGDRPLNRKQGVMGVLYHLPRSLVHKRLTQLQAERIRFTPQEKAGDFWQLPVHFALCVMALEEPSLGQSNFIEALENLGFEMEEIK